MIFGIVGDEETELTGWQDRVIEIVHDVIGRITEKYDSVFFATSTHKGVEQAVRDILESYILIKPAESEYFDICGDGS